MTNSRRSPSSSSFKDTAKLSWTNLINESVHISDDIDIGDIDAVTDFPILY
jgi:hypothetical protein